MTTGRINQVATISLCGCRRGTGVPTPQRRFASECGMFALRPCISFAIVMYHCSAPAPVPRKGTAGKTGLAVPAHRDSISPTEHCRGAPQVRETGIRTNGRLVFEPLIHTTPKQEHRSSRDRMPGTRCKSKKRKANPEVCFSSRCLMSPRSGRPQPERLYKERGEIKI